MKLQKNVIYVYRGKTYKYSDPILGIDGEGGSMWGLVGDKLIEKGIYDCVVFKCVGRGASSILDWQPNKPLFRRIIDGNKELISLNLSLTAILFHQGEGDNKYRPYRYQSMNYYRDF